MATIDPSIQRYVDQMKMNAAARDKRMGMVRKVRDGDLTSLWPDQFSEKYPQAIVANFIDVVARDLAEVIAPLPTLACSSGAMRAETDKRRAERKNRIGEHYWRQSQLDVQMFYGADQYLSYGFLPVWVEANYGDKRPVIHIEDPAGAYFELDRWLRVKRYARCWTQDCQELISMFPDYATTILYDRNGDAYTGTDVDVVRYIDATTVTLYLPSRNNTILASYGHGMSRCPVEIGLRPGLHMDPRGQFDDVLYVQLARAVMAQLTLEAGHKAVQGPIAMPMDVVELNIGPDAVIQTDNPEKIHRVALEVPSAAFALEAQLDQEMKIGSRYPDARLGTPQASVITGKGVQALMGGFDTQIKSAQSILGRLLRDVTALCFEMDELLWPNKSETISGTMSGRSYQIVYRPKQDIGGNYTCDITYGFASGMSPANALVTMLQARGDGLIGRDTVRRNMPWNLDSDQEQRDLDVQEIEDAMKQGLFAALQSSGQMMAQGMTQEALLFFNAANALITGRQNGKPVGEVLVQALTPPPPPPAPEGAAPGQPGAPGAPGAPGGDDLAGVGPTGLPPNVAPGQAGLAPGGMPDIQSLVAGFRGGQPTMDSSVRKRIPTG